MKTKLVYVLTCAPEHYFIEQALISIYTARYYNPDAMIVLIVDDKTNKLFVGKRKEILDYISEKIVVVLDENMSLEIRSRFLKTSFRNLVSNGDLLFIDCDTLITCLLDEIDNCSFEIAAVLDSHLPINKYHKSIYKHVEERSKIAGWDISKEEYYFSSGVIYVKDTENNKLFFEKWHSSWFNQLKEGFIGDQPYFALANIECGRPIQKLDDVWNCIMYAQPLFDRKAKILHFSSFRNMSYVFGKNFLNKVKVEGVKGCEFIKFSILHPYITYIPFDNTLHHYKLIDFIKLFKAVCKTSKNIYTHLNCNFESYLSTEGLEGTICKFYLKKQFILGTSVLVAYKFYKVHFNKKFKYTTNINLK
jgi:hypothetical protein